MKASGMRPFHVVVICLLAWGLLKFLDTRFLHLLPGSLTNIVAGLLIIALGVAVFVDRQLALEVYWRGAPKRPDDRTILVIVRVACVIVSASGAFFVVAGARDLLRDFVTR
jgi:hypothetical protein